MIVNRELTQEIRIERHREGNAPIVFEFVDSAGDPYAVTGTYVFYIGRRTLPGVIAGNLLTFELLPADKAALPQGVYPFEIAYLDGANDPIPFKGVFSWAVLSGNQSSNTVPRIRVTVGPTSYTAGVSVIVGPKGESAYQLAVDNGFVGSLSEWLDSLGSGAGTSAMVKAVYDPDNDGIVDNAAKIEGLPINQISLNGGYF